MKNQKKKNKRKRGGQKLRKVKGQMQREKRKTYSKESLKQEKK